MKVFTWQDILDIKAGKSDFQGFFDEGSALTIGSFDGTHRGHFQLFSAVSEYRKANSHVKAGVVTFSFPPKFLNRENNANLVLSTLSGKLSIFESLGFDFALAIDFSYDFSRISGEDFLSLMKDVCSMQFLAVGSDFRCGFKNDTGTSELAEFSRRFHFSLRVIDEVLINGEKVSSSKIRDCVKNGNLEKASVFLGYHYTLDFSDLAPSIEKIESGLIRIASGKIRQIIPAVGRYKATAFFSGSVSLNTILSVDKDFLLLEIPPEYLSFDLEKIEIKSCI